MHVQNLKQVAKIAELAQDKGCTSAQLALAWVRRDTEDISYTAVMTYSPCISRATLCQIVCMR